MTYLQLVNGVLKRLRENQVSTVEENEYSTLIGSLINDAKSEVELAHGWSALRSTVTFSTADGTSEYSITGAGNHPIFKAMVNDSSNWFITSRDASFFNRAYYMGTITEGPPRNFTLAGVDASGDVKVKLYPQPDAVYNIRADLVAVQAELTDDADAILIPSNPVIQLAYAMALRERGESGGQSGQEQIIYADRVLSDHIAIDANYFPTETAFVVV